MSEWGLTSPSAQQTYSKIGHFGDESFQSITIARTAKRQNTQITQNNTTQKWPVNSTTDTLKLTYGKREDRQSLV